MLQDVFACRNDNSMDRIRRLMDLARQNSAVAAQTVNSAFVRGCGFNFENLDKCQGAYSPEQNMVYLNPQRSDAELLSTLVHECRHALQPKGFKNKENNIRTNLQWVRATEADAMAYECAAAFEMRDALPQVWEQFEKKHGTIASSYEAAIKTGNQAQALNEAFKAWHDDAKYVSVYDTETIRNLSASAVRGGTDFLSKNLSGEEIGERVCLKDGVSYLEKGFMTSEHALTVDKNQVWPEIMRLQSTAKSLTDIEDRSVEDLYTREGKNAPVSQKRQNDVQINRGATESRSAFADLSKKQAVIRNYFNGR